MPSDKLLFLLILIKIIFKNNLFNIYQLFMMYEKEMAIHSSTLAWKIPWTEEPDRLQSMGSQRVRHDWATSLHRKITLSHSPGHLLLLRISFKEICYCLWTFHILLYSLHTRCGDSGSTLFCFTKLLLIKYCGLHICSGAGEVSSAWKE